MYRNLIVVPRTGFTIATVQRSRSPFLCTTRSRAGKLDPAHPSPRAPHGVGLSSLKQLNTTIELSKEREEEENGEKYFLVLYSRDRPSL
jgi:hypothetical protein